MERVKELKEDMKPIEKVHPIMTKTVYNITRIGRMGGEKIKSIPFQFQNQVKTVSERENKVVGKMKNIPFQNQLKTVTWRRPKIVTWTLRKQQEILQFLQRKAVPEANRPALESDT